MTIYLLLLGVITIGGLIFCERNPSRKKDLIFLLVCSILMFCVSVTRALSVGVDTMTYVHYFQSLGDKSWSYLFSPENLYAREFGYSLLSMLLSRISLHPMVLLGGVSFLILVLRGIFIWKYSPSVWVSVFVFVAYGFFNYSICTYRQEIAISIALFALPMLQRKKMIPYFLIILLACTFHTSALLLLPLYFLAWLPINKITLSVYAGGTLLVLLFSEPILTFISTYVYKSYTLDNYYTGGRSVNTAFIPVITMLSVLFLVKRLEEYKAATRPLINFVCYAGLLFILTIKHFVFQRVALLVLPAVLLLLPELLACLRPNASRYPDLAEYERLDKVKQKQQLYKYTIAKKKLEDDRSVYLLTLGSILVAGWIYFLFILVANRLDYTPFLFYFQSPETAVRFYTPFGFIFPGKLGG